jgi:hypothetical protein
MLERRAMLLAAGLGACLAGCQDAGGHPPTARIDFADPAFSGYVPLDDDYRTDVALDGSASNDAFDDPQGLLPLAFRWQVDDPAPRVVAGALDGARLTVRIAGARPTAIRLTVTDTSGASGSASVEIGVTLPADAGP